MADTLGIIMSRNAKYRFIYSYILDWSFTLCYLNVLGSDAKSIQFFFCGRPNRSKIFPAKKSGIPNRSKNFSMKKVVDQIDPKFFFGRPNRSIFFFYKKVVDQIDPKFFPPKKVVDQIDPIGYQIDPKI